MQSPPKTNIDPWNKCLNPKENNLLTSNTFKPKTRGIFNHITRTKSIAIKLTRHDTNTVTDCIFSLITFQQIQMCSAPSKVSASSLWNGWSQFFCVLNDWGFPICIHSSQRWRKISQVITLKDIYSSEKINAHKKWGWLQFIGCQRKKKQKKKKKVTLQPSLVILIYYTLNLAITSKVITKFVDD